MSTSQQYEEEFNKQLSQQLEMVRKQQPNHIPVYGMKYKNASKYLVEDLKESLTLFPKQFKLKKIHEIIEKESIEYCKEKLKSDRKVEKQGEDFELPTFYLYTIEIVTNPEKNMSTQSQTEQDIKDSSSTKKQQKPIGKFVKLDLEMTFEEAFNKFGRENVLTVVYTDAEEAREKYTKAQKSVEKWLQRILFIVLALIIIPYLMGGEEEEEEEGMSNNEMIKEVNQYSSKSRLSIADTMSEEYTNSHDMNEERRLDYDYDIDYDDETL